MTDHETQRETAGDRADRRELDDAASLITSQLDQRGIRTFEHDPAGELARLLDAVELFELAVAARGGDSYVNSPFSSRPERAGFVVPPRNDDESVPSYTARVLAAAGELR